jgi:hypothetical protein
MSLTTLNHSEAVTGDDKFAALDKVSFGQRFGVSKRTVDNWLLAGCPHLKLSARMVRLPVVEASEWVKNRFLTQRRTSTTS